VKVLLDENLPHKLRSAITGHEVFTVDYMGWSGLTNGKLLAVAEESEFEVMLTADRSLHLEQNLNNRGIAIISLSAQKWPVIRDRLEQVQMAVDSARPGSFQAVDFLLKLPT
jgi:hypothetical protein